MLRRFCQFSFLISGLSAATLAGAASAPRDPTIQHNRDTEGSVARPSTVVVIDAGHGGYDRGGIPGQRTPEKVMNLDVAQRLRSVLQSGGYRVVMTRDSDVFVPLGTRVAIANSYRNAIFVCIHFNSATRSGASGIETYFYSRESLALASAIHYYVAGGAPSGNRGVRRRGYFVLRRTRIPAVLVECGFLTNPSEAQYAQSSAYRQKLAEEIARGIRGRSTGTTSTLGTRVAAVPLQPFIDQTRVRDPDISRRHSKKSSRHQSSKSKKSKSSTSSGKSKKKSKKTTED
jgi:N-acetylmuramoyl-L-alanine amidase